MRAAIVLEPRLPGEVHHVGLDGRLRVEVEARPRGEDVQVALRAIGGRQIEEDLGVGRLEVAVPDVGRDLVRTGVRGGEVGAPDVRAGGPHLAPDRVVPGHLRVRGVHGRPVHDLGRRTEGVRRVDGLHRLTEPVAQGAFAELELVEGQEPQPLTAEVVLEDRDEALLREEAHHEVEVGLAVLDAVAPHGRGAGRREVGVDPRVREDLLHDLHGVHPLEDPVVRAEREARELRLEDEPHQPVSRRDEPEVFVLRDEARDPAPGERDAARVVARDEDAVELPEEHAGLRWDLGCPRGAERDPEQVLLEVLVLEARRDRVEGVAGDLRGGVHRVDDGPDVAERAGHAAPRAERVVEVVVDRLEVVLVAGRVALPVVERVRDVVEGGVLRRLREVGIGPQVLPPRDDHLAAEGLAEPLDVMDARHTPGLRRLRVRARRRLVRGVEREIADP
ncbi:MAG: hypothetical protein R3B82_08990 [Sandaracinaceae bacterium]